MTKHSTDSFKPDKRPVQATEPNSPEATDSPEATESTGATKDHSAKDAAGAISEGQRSPRAVRPLGTEHARTLAAAAARVALDNKGREVMVIDVCQQSAEFDLFVLATGSSRRQLHAISEQIDDVLEKELGDRRLGIEGYEESRWIVLDYGSVIIHLFDEDTREYYDLESLWADGKPIALSELGVEVAEQ